MKISKRQLKRIIREEYSRLKRKGLVRETPTFDQRDEDRFDDPNNASGWPEISMYDRGYDDYAENGYDQPSHLDNQEYMAGWEAAQDDLSDYYGEL